MAQVGYVVGDKEYWDKVVALEKGPCTSRRSDENRWLQGTIKVCYPYKRNPVYVFWYDDGYEHVLFTEPVKPTWGLFYTRSAKDKAVYRARARLLDLYQLGRTNLSDLLEVGKDEKRLFSSLWRDLEKWVEDHRAQLKPKVFATKVREIATGDWEAP